MALSLPIKKILLCCCIGLFISYLKLSIATTPINQKKQTKIKSPILIGMSTALTGPARALGQGMKTGVQIYFDSVNKAGGINGRKLKLIVLDDGYEPAKTAPNMRKLIDEYGVMAIIGNVGTPTAIVSVPIANKKKTLLFGAFTGAGILRKNPPDRYIINVRASYAQETAAIVKGLLQSGIEASELAFFTQNDGYGDAGYQGAMSALHELGYQDPEQLPYGRYTRNTLNVEAGLAKILDAHKAPKAIIIVGTYAPSAKFMRMAKEDFPNALFFNVSFVGSRALMKAAGAAGENSVITQVVPHYDAKLPAIQAYREALKIFSPNTEPSFVSLEGYLAAKIFVIGLKHAALHKPLTREGIIDAIEQLHDVDIGIGMRVTYNRDKHQALDVVWPTIIKNGKIIPLDADGLRKHIKDAQHEN